MDQVLRSFSELAASAIAARLRDVAQGNPPSTEFASRHGRIAAASVQFTLANGDEETTAEIAVSSSPE